jgi:hypothetical protein
VVAGVAGPAGASDASPAPAAPVWALAPGATWQWQITGTIDTSYDVDMYDIDLEDAVPSARTVHIAGFGDVHWGKGLNSGVIAELHSRGIIVICYIDTGAAESYRPDAYLFPKSVLGGASYDSNGDQWKGEKWLDIRKKSWPKFAPIMWSRFDLAAAIGCDGVEPDQNNPIGNHPGFPITRSDQERWYLEVAAEAHARGLSVGQKNGIETTTPATVAAFDWNLNEECFQYHECKVLKPFITAGKAVFQTEYRGDPASFCPKAQALGFSSLKKKLNLGSWVVAC